MFFKLSQNYLNKKVLYIVIINVTHAINYNKCIQHSHIHCSKSTLMYNNV